jgi:predicted dehydrogenase
MTRILLAGLGNRGRMWGRIIAERPDTEFAGIMDVDPARIAAFQSDHGSVASYTDLATALTESRPTLVVLATPPGGHLAQARPIFAAGIPLLCEKPLALDLQEAAEIVRLSEEYAVPLSVGLNFRYLPVTQAIRTFVAEAPFGAPGFGSFAYHRNRDWWRPGMNSYPQTMQHPMMLEQSIHHLDLIRFCYGREVEQVQCRSWNPPWSVYAHDANVSCLLSMQGGLEVDYLGTWTGGWNALKFQWRTDCPGGVIIQNELFSDLSTARTEDAALTPVPLAPCIPFLDDTRALLDAFVAAMPLGGEMPCSGRDHLRSLALCFAAIEAHETGRRVDVAEFQRRHGLPV